MSISITVDVDDVGDSAGGRLRFARARTHTYGTDENMTGHVACWVDVGTTPGGRDFTLCTASSEWLRAFADLLYRAANEIDEAKTLGLDGPRNRSLPIRDLLM